LIEERLKQKERVRGFEEPSAAQTTGEERRKKEEEDAVYL